ncbi:thioesterase II family protein [Streptomyces sp. NPDC088337]|uniref:thioesterase II family protein n=1 Tax=unclassified Streptomyces TaxID=2593676 RepID=UPI002DDC0F0B|nr:alpha/beta fold hydrolase [Streptomyces sp. NBC_01788]WSB29171.1 alpha/beta fold hydrolase [Streptomyces sp. NBC_01788]
MTVPSPWLKRIGGPAQAEGGTPELVCFPHSGGAASWYRPLAAELGDDILTVAVQYPGRQERHDEPAITDLHELANRTAEALGNADAGVPRIFFGHSMGAILAYEVAQRLGERGPAALLASGRPAPDRVRLTTSYLLDDAALAEQISWLGGTTKELLDDPEMRSLLLPVIRSDYRASETYRPRPGCGPLGCSLIALGGDGDPVAPLDDVRAWSRHTTGPFRLELLPGGHFYLLDHWAAIAGLVRTCVRPLTSVPGIMPG